MVVTASHAQQNFGGIVDSALSENEVIIERYGTPRVAIINYQRYQRLLAVEREMKQLLHASQLTPTQRSKETESDVESWGTHVVHLLNTLDFSSWREQEIDDPVAWVKEQRRQQQEKREKLW